MRPGWNSNQSWYLIATNTCSLAQLGRKHTHGRIILGSPGSEDALGAKPSGISPCTDGFGTEPLSRVCWFSEDGSLLCGTV